MMSKTSKCISLTSGLLSLALLLSACARDPQKAKARYLVSGQNYMKKGQYGDADVEFRNALRLDPQFVEAYYQLAQAKLAQSDWNAALVSLERAIALDSERLDARLDRARLYLAARQFSVANEEATNVINRDRNNVAAYQLRGASLIGLQKRREALEDFKKITELQPTDGSAYVNLALVEIGLRKTAEAERDLKKAVSVDPQSIQAYADLAHFYRLDNRQEEAEQVLLEAISKNPDGTLLYLDLADLQLSQGRKDEAEATIKKLLAQVPNSSDVAQAIGDFYFQRKQADRALVEYERGLSISSKNLEIKKRIEDLYLSTGQTQLATKLDQELMMDAPKDTVVRINHGRLRMAQGDSANAIIYLQKIAADAVDSSKAHYYLAMAYWQNGDTNLARSALMDALRVSPSLPMAIEALARLSLAQGNAKDAQIYAQELIEKFPADPSSRQILWEALYRQGQSRSAEEQILIAKQLRPDDPIVRLDLALTYAAEKEWPEAQKEFEAALQLDPHNTTILGEYADYLIIRNQVPGALALVREYVTSNPNDADGHIILGALYHKSKNYSSAQTEVERAIQLNPNHSQAYIRIGNILKEEGEIDLAIARFQKAFDLQPKSAPLATLVGNLYLEKGELETARKYYAQALDVDPNFAVALANTAWVYAQENKNLDVALEMAQKAKSLMPEVPSITDTLAWVMYKRGNYDSAVPLLQDCVEKSSDSAKFRFHLGMTLLRTGQMTKGKQELEAALRMDLDALDAQDARQALSSRN
jgi:tetratricopeptide (TPR) repeat protein